MKRVYLFWCPVMKARDLLIALLLALPPALRLLPTVATSMPFSPDTWPLIGCSEYLKGIGSMAPGYIGYHARWPALILFMGTLSQLTSVELLILYRFTGPILLCIMAYLYALSLGGRRDTLLYMVLPLSIPVFLVYTSTTLKELFSYIFVLQLAILLHKGIDGARGLLALATTLFLISISHPLTSVIASATLFLLLVLYPRETSSLRYRVSLPMLALIPIAYNVYVSPQLLGTAYMFISRYPYVVIIGLAGLSTIAILRLRGFGEGSSVKGSYIVAAASAIALATTALYMHSIHRGLYSLLYGIPLALFITYLYMVCKGARSFPAVFAKTYIVASLLAIPLLLFTPSSIDILHRPLNQLVIASVPAILYGWRDKGRLFFKLATALGIASSAVIVFSLLQGLDPIAYYWLYRYDEVNAAYELAINQSYPVGYDAKGMYLFDYIGAEGSYYYTEWLAGIKPMPHKSFLVYLYQENYIYGLAFKAQPSPILREKLGLLYNGSLVFKTNNLEVYLVKPTP